MVSNTIIYSGPILRHPTGFANAEGLAWIRFVGQDRTNTIIKLKDNSLGLKKVLLNRLFLMQV